MINHFFFLIIFLKNFYVRITNKLLKIKFHAIYLKFLCITCVLLLCITLYIILRIFDTENNINYNF